MLFGAAVVGWIGWALMDDAKTTLGKFLGFFLVLMAGATAGHATPEQGVMHMDHDKCAQYAWLDQEWKCVPWEEAG